MYKDKFEYQKGFVRFMNGLNISLAIKLPIHGCCHSDMLINVNEMYTPCIIHNFVYKENLVLLPNMTSC